jgi:hypothetical protein
MISLHSHLLSTFHNYCYYAAHLSNLYPSMSFSYMHPYSFIHVYSISIKKDSPTSSSVILPSSYGGMDESINALHCNHHACSCGVVVAIIILSFFLWEALHSSYTSSSSTTIMMMMWWCVNLLFCYWWTTLQTWQQSTSLSSLIIVIYKYHKRLHWWCFPLSLSLYLATLTYILYMALAAFTTVAFIILKINRLTSQWVSSI